MPQSQRPRIPKKFDLSAVWSCGPRPSQWDLLWTRLLAYALEHRALPDEANGAVALRDPSDSEPSATSDDSRQPDDDQRDS